MAVCDLIIYLLSSGATFWGSYGKSLQVFEVVMTGTQVQPA